MSSPLCANSSRDSSRAGLGIGPVAEVETEKQVGTGVVVMCSECEVIGPVVVLNSILVVIGPGVRVGGSVDAFKGVEATEVFSLVVQAVTVKVSVSEVIGPAYELANPMAHVDPGLKTGSVDEVRGSVRKLVFFAILSEASVIHVGSGRLVDLVSEVVVTVEESTSPVVRVGPSVMDPVVEAPDSVLQESTLTSL